MFQCYALNDSKIFGSYINPDSLRILILLANSISAEDIERSNFLCEDIV